MRNPSAKSLIIGSWTVTSLLLCSAAANALTPLEQLGKHIFFDTSLSTPGNKQGCVSCHEPKMGWVFPDKRVHATTVVAPGAAPHRQGGIKPPMNAYASLAPIFQQTPPVPIPGFDPRIIPNFGGGNFWDGRAEGCGAGPVNPAGQCPVPNTGDVGVVSETITPAALPLNDFGKNAKYALGPTADQALNPFGKGVEQNAGEKKTCQQVKTAKYKIWYEMAWDVPIDCGSGLHTSFQRLAVALSAYQKSTDVVSFSSKRDTALAADKKNGDGKFPLAGFSADENAGHDLFYVKGGCSACHNGLPGVLAAGFRFDDPDGTNARQLYTDSRFHNIGVPFNREIPGLKPEDKKGLSEHVANPGLVAPGFFKTPSLRNVAKGEGKAYTHTGWFKSLKRLVHFYNTRDHFTADANFPAIPRCETLGIINATEKETLNSDGTTKCWPKPENENQFVAGPPLLGNLGLTDKEEDQIVAYLNTLTDLHVVEAP